MPGDTEQSDDDSVASSSYSSWSDTGRTVGFSQSETDTVNEAMLDVQPTTFRQPRHPAALPPNEEVDWRYFILHQECLLDFDKLCWGHEAEQGQVRPL